MEHSLNNDDDDNNDENDDDNDDNNDDNVKDELINMTWAWDKEKIWVRDRNQTHDLPNTGRALYPLSYENSWRTRSIFTEFVCDRRPAYC